MPADPRFGPPLTASVVPPEVQAAGAAFGASHLFGDAPIADQMGASGVARPFWPAGAPGVGLRLASYQWPATEAAAAKGVILFVHGHGSYELHEVLAIKAAGTAPAYPSSWAAAWNEAGFSVAGIDNRGCGFSDGVAVPDAGAHRKRAPASAPAGGLRCYVDRFDDYVDDVLAYADALAHAGGAGFEGLPIFLVGVSLGGCVAVHAAERAPHAFAGVVLLAPMLSIDAVARRGVNGLLVHVAALLAWLAPSLPVARMPKNTLFPDLQALWDADPLCAHFPTRARNAVEYLRVTEALQARLEAVAFPFLAFHGDADTLTEPAGTVALGARAASADKTVRIVPDRWHVLTREPGCEARCDEIAAWCAARVDGRGGAKGRVTRNGSSGLLGRLRTKSTTQ